MTTSSLKIWFFETRPHFLLLVPVSVLVGVSVAVYEAYAINAGHLILAFVGALLAHISVNVLNDYFDYRSGIDFRTTRTPFSGGSGILPSGLLSPRQVYIFGVACIVAIILIGGYFTYVLGWAILPLGFLGIITLYFYTTHFTKSPVLCAIAPGLGFGPLMVMGTYFALTGTYSLAAGLASLIPGFLVSNLLLLNQFPDVEADASAGRYHLPIAIGRRKSSWLYAALIVDTYLTLIVSVAARVLPVYALFALLTLPLSWITVRGVQKYYDDIGHLVPFMGRNVIVTLSLPICMAIGLFVGTAP
ncbi:prenyltransferase [Chloroflexota bacterium]